jgi:hypothetical protein
MYYLSSSLAIMLSGDGAFLTVPGTMRSNSDIKTQLDSLLVVARSLMLFNWTSRCRERSEQRNWEKDRCARGIDRAHRDHFDIVTLCWSRSDDHIIL